MITDMLHDSKYLFKVNKEKFEIIRLNVLKVKNKDTDLTSNIFGKKLS